MSSHHLFIGQLHVHYGQFYIEPDDDDYVDMGAAFEGQNNGICGASQANRLFLSTGLHTGAVHLIVELCEANPAPDETWEEVVECSFQHVAGVLYLCQWAHEKAWPLDVPPGTYRVRYSAKSMLGDWQTSGDTCPPQHYMLQFWPASHEADTVLKVTGEYARYRHGEMRKKQDAASPARGG